MRTPGRSRMEEDVMGDDDQRGSGVGFRTGAEMEVVGTGKIGREERGMETNINPSP